MSRRYFHAQTPYFQRKLFVAALFLGFLGLVAPAHAGDGDFVSVSALGGAGRDEGASVAVDPEGNVYVTGYFTGTMDFDPGPDTFELSASGEARDIFVVKLDVFRNLLWASRIGGADDDEGTSISVDSVGNICLAGYFQGAVDFDAGPGVTSLTAVGSRDLFFARYTTQGNFVWVRQMGGNFDEFVYAIALDDADNVYAAGFFQDTVDFDPGVNMFALTSAGLADAFVLKLDPTGTFLWARQFGGPGNDVGYSVAVDGDGNVHAAGYFNDTADFDSEDIAAPLNSAGARDAFVAKLDADGGLAWARGLGGLEDDEARGIAIDTDGNVLVTGDFRDEVDFDPGVGELIFNAAGPDIFVAKFSPGASLLWARQMGGPDEDAGVAVAVNIHGDVYVTGHFSSAADFNPAGAPVSLNAAGGWDVFAAKLNDTGALRWARAVGGSSFEQGNDISVNDDGRVYIAGYYQGTVDFDPRDGVASYQTAGGNDVFVLQLSGSDDIETGFQSADQDTNQVISLSELLRVIQFYNSLGLHCADVPTDTEDGYVPGPGLNQACIPYDTDYNPQNWVISLSELLRIIQFYNSLGYRYCPLDGTEDGFCPGAQPI